MRSLFTYLPAALSDAEIARITALAAQTPHQQASIMAPQTDPEIRISTISWLSDEDLQNKLWQFVKTANEADYHLAIDNRAEIQFTSYDAAYSGHYDWHHDVNWNGGDDYDRKLSLTIQLSDSDDYEGGDFEFEEVTSNVDFRQKGTIIIFPSVLRHRVTPVTKGVRHSLVAWFSGPYWR